MLKVNFLPVTASADALLAAVHPSLKGSLAMVCMTPS
jgi:hypothetical protein